MGLAKAIKDLTPALYRLRIFVFLLAAIILGIAVYYFLYVRSQTGYFNDRNFRKLSLISSQIGSKIANTASVLEKTSDRFIRPLADDPYKFRTDAKLKEANKTDLQEVFKRLKNDSPQIIPVNIDTEKWSPNIVGSVTLTAVRYEGDSSWLYFDYVANGIDEGTMIRVQAKSELNSLIQPFLTARIGHNPDQFQNILIAEADTARVILQHDSTQIRLASLDKLTAANVPGKTINLKELASTSNAVDVTLAGANYRLFSHPLKLSLPTNSGAAPTPTWIITGLIKSDYFQAAAWTITVPYPVLITFGFLVGVLVFSWPFLKLVLAGPKDRFRTHDVYLLVFATLIVLAVFTAFILHVLVYWKVEAELDAQVKTLAGHLTENFEAELNDALLQLDKFSQNRNLLDALNSPEQSAGVIGVNVSRDQRDANADDVLTCPPEDRDIYQLKDKNKSKILPCIMGSCDTIYPYFDMVSWIDESGMQRAKWSVNDYTTQYVSVADRAYFQNVRKKHFYEFRGHKFWLEPLVSKTTGRNQVEISQAVPNSNWTVAFDTRLLSLMDPVLPDGFGYVIINNDGKVLFHSDEVHHLGENLFEESDDDNRLRSAVIGRTDRSLNVRYSGQDHRFFVTTLNGFQDWSLVVFRNKQPLRSAFLELLTSVTTLFLIHIVVLMAAFTIFFLIYVRKRRKAWLWPEEKKRPRYVQLVFLMLSLAILSTLLTVRLHGQSLVWVSAGLGLFSGVVFFASLRFGPWRRDMFQTVTANVRDWVARVVLQKQVKRTTLQTSLVPASFNSATPEQEFMGFWRYDRVYALNLTLFVLLIAILPMGAFFKYEYDTQVRFFVKHAQFSMATAVERRDERIRNQYANVAQLDPIQCDDKTALQAPSTHNHETNILTRRLGEKWDVYQKFFYDTTPDNVNPKRSNEPPISDADLLSSVSTLLPVSSQAAVERRGLIGTASVTGVCSWDPFSGETLVLNLDGTKGTPGWPWTRLQTQVPLLTIPPIPGIGFMLLMIPLYFLLHFMIRKVFLLDLHKPSSYSLKKFLCDKIDRNSFVVVNAPFVNKIKGKAGNLYLQKFSDLASIPDWKSKFDDSQCGNGNVIALDQFEYELDNADINKRRLEVLENLLGRNKTLLVFSTVDTSKYSFENGHVNDDLDEAGRWAEVLISNFFTEYAEDTDDRHWIEVADESSFWQQVEIQRARIKKEGLQGRKEEDVNKLIDTLYLECAPRVPLQKVGLEILRRKDFVTLTEDHLLGRIVSQARLYYGYIWHSCSPGEKQTLCHLAQDRRLSHRDPDIQPLLKRELIVRDDGLHLFNESFRKFVLGAEQFSTVAEDDQKARDESLWQTLKVPILATMITIAAFLFWTQQDVFTSSLAVVTGVTTLITAVFKMVSVFQSPKPSAPSS